MEKCGRIESCGFFKTVITEMPTVSQMIVRRYCHGDYESCARLTVFGRLGSGAVPNNLAPNDHERARRIIEEADPGTSRRTPR
jgi:hypothetical protein